MRIVLICVAAVIAAAALGVPARAPTDRRTRRDSRTAGTESAPRATPCATSRWLRHQSRDDRRRHPCPRWSRHAQPVATRFLRNPARRVRRNRRRPLRRRALARPCRVRATAGRRRNHPLRRSRREDPEAAASPRASRFVVLTTRSRPTADCSTSSSTCRQEEPAVSRAGLRPRGEPTPPQGRRRSRRGGGGDARSARDPPCERRRPLGLHALRAAATGAVRPRARHITA